jgi:hypothetical protein
MLSKGKRAGGEEKGRRTPFSSQRGQSSFQTGGTTVSITSCSFAGGTVDVARSGRKMARDATKSREEPCSFRWRRGQHARQESGESGSHSCAALQVCIVGFLRVEKRQSGRERKGR